MSEADADLFGTAAFGRGSRIDTGCESTGTGFPVTPQSGAPSGSAPVSATAQQSQSALAYGLTSPTSLTLGGVNNAGTGTISLFGDGTSQAMLSATAGAAANSGDLELHNDAVLTTASGVNLTNGGTLNIDTVAFSDGGEGGSRATIGGALSNTAALTSGRLYQFERRRARCAQRQYHWRQNARYGNGHRCYQHKRHRHHRGN